MLITFEGPEGAGKSTVVKAIKESLVAPGLDVLATREPGSSDVGRTIRDLLLNGGAIDPKTELFLYLADRAEHVVRTIRPALDSGRTVLCDRFIDSTVAYQGYARGFDVEEIRRLNEFVTGGLVPNLTLLLDLDPAIGLARISHGDRLDREPIEFHEKVRAGFLSESKRDPRRWVVIDASLPVNEVVERCHQSVLSLIKGDD